MRGRIASAFGSKPNGTRNDGVNIRAPEGTPVVAAENGVVVYAGDEIPGYGRMLLISHANGFLTAYAHNSKLLVDGRRPGRAWAADRRGRQQRQRDLAAAAFRDSRRQGGRSIPWRCSTPAVTQVASVRIAAAHPPRR